MNKLNVKEENNNNLSIEEEESISNGTLSYNSVKNKDKEVKCSISFKVLGKFYVYQLHKYLIYILLICFIQFSLYDFLKLIVGYC